HRHALELVAERGPFRGHSPRIQLAVVGVRAEVDDAQLAVGRGRRRRARPRRGGQERGDGGHARRETAPPGSRVAGHETSFLAWRDSMRERAGYTAAMADRPLLGIDVGGTKLLLVAQWPDHRDV